MCANDLITWNADDHTKSGLKIRKVDRGLRRSTTGEVTAKISISVRLKNRCYFLQRAQNFQFKLASNKYRLLCMF